MTTNRPKPKADDLQKRIHEHCQTLGLPLAAVEAKRSKATNTVPNAGDCPERIAHGTAG